MQCKKRKKEVAPELCQTTSFQTFHQTAIAVRKCLNQLGNLLITQTARVSINNLAKLSQQIQPSQSGICK